MGSKLKLQRASFRGLDTAWLEGGVDNGPIMMFLHGYPDTPDTFTGQYEHFKERYRIVAPFTRGALPSERADTIDRYGLRALSLDYLQILKSIDPGKRRSVVLIGHDLGAAAAWALAPYLGNRLQSMIILNGLSLQQMSRRFKDLNQHLKSWYIYLMQVPSVPEKALQRFPQLALKLAYYVGGLKPSQRPSLAKSLGGVVNPANQYRAFAREIPKALMQGETPLRAPVLVVWGDRDPFVSPPHAQEFARAADKTTIRILEGQHWLHRENPEEINRLMDEFIHVS